MGSIVLVGCGYSENVETYTISFYNNGGDGMLEPIKVKFGEAMPDLNVELSPTKPGYHFIGYYYVSEADNQKPDEEINGTIYYTNDLISVRDWDKKYDTTLYAKWGTVPVDTLKFEVSIILTNEASIGLIEKTYKPNDFQEVNCINVYEYTAGSARIVAMQLEAQRTGDWSGLEERIRLNMLINTSTYRRIFSITVVLTERKKEKMLEVVKLLEARSDVYHVGPSSDDINRTFFDFEPFLSTETEKQIRQDYLDIYIKPKFADAAIEDVWIEKHYGSYDDCTAVMIFSKYGEYDDAECEVIFDAIYGPFFRYSNENRIIVWKNGCFYELQAALNQGLLGLREIMRIANYHAGLSMEIENQIAEDYLGYYKYEDIYNFWSYTRYCGTYNGYSSFLIDAGRWCSLGFIIEETLFPHTGCCEMIYLWKEGQIYELREVYNQGLLTKEDVRNIAHYYNLREINLENHAGLHHRIMERIIDNYYDIYLRPIYGAPKYDAGGYVGIEKYYGSYNYIDADEHHLLTPRDYSIPIIINDCVVAMMSIPQNGILNNMPWEETIAGILFRYENSNRILVWKVEAISVGGYYDLVGTFYELQEAYDLGFLTVDDIKSVAYYHEKGKTLSYYGHYYGYY